jgi:hypothetical protein
MVGLKSHDLGWFQTVAKMNKEPEAKKLLRRKVMVIMRSLSLI